MKKSKVTAFFKKSILFLLLATVVVYATSFFDFSYATTVSYQDSSSWIGEDINVTALDDISYDSIYEPYETISGDSSQINTSKIYVIEDALDLYQFSIDSQGTSATTYLSLDYVLGNDIDYFDALKVSMNYQFIPIGFNSPFTGTFDGQGYEITNLIFRSVNTENGYNTYMSGLVYYSMFSKTSSTAEIKNFGLINPLIVQALDLGLMTYVSTFVGLNQGLLENVYYIDTREESAGINAEGDFIISGLVSNNTGTIRNSFIATPYVKSQAVTQNLTSSLLVYLNTGTITNLYYDQEILSDNDSAQSYGVGLDTADFQNSALFSSTWYFKDSYEDLTTDTNLYSQLYLDDTYPILQGLSIDQGNLLINDAVDLNYMNELLLISGFFRSSTYILNSDIDMNQVARNSYKAAEVSFDGVFTSNTISGSTLYTHTGTGGSESYYSIIDLNISQASYVGDYASYAFFAALFGQVTHLNFVNLMIVPEDVSAINDVDNVYIAGLAGASNDAYITDVHIDINIDFQAGSEALGQLYIGGLIAYGSLDLSYSSTTGTINAIEVNYDSRMTHNYVAGMIGYASKLTIDHVLNELDILGFSYKTTPTNTTYYGGIAGYANLVSANKIVNRGNITSHETYDVSLIYMGGIIGYQNDLEEDITYIYQNGDLEVGVYGSETVYVAGYGYITDQESDIDITSITNNGTLTFLSPGTLTTTELNSVNVYAAGVLITNNTDGEIKGLFNLHSQSIDMSFIDKYAGNILALDQSDLSIEQSYQSGDLSFYTSQTLVNDYVYISANVYGKNLSLNHLRQEGDISFYMSNNSTTTLTSPFFYFYGLFEEASLGFDVTNGYQGGDISIEKSTSNTISYDLYISGMGYENRNIEVFDTYEIDSQSIDIEEAVGSVDTMLNSGNIYITGNFNGHIKVAGILLYNQSILSNAINLGDIEIYNDVITANDQIEAGGIVYAMISEYAQIRDSANNGDIKVASNSTLGYAHASGIAVRNDKNENGTDISSGANHRFGKIMFSINYGDIYAYNGTSESSYTITNETRSKASGILTLGILSVVNNINYGNIFSRYLGAGIFGFVYYSKFDSIDTDEVYVSNLINYGKVRQITAYNSTSHAFTYNMTTTPSTGLPYAFGAIVGKIHTGTSTWAFTGDVDYPIDSIYFGYLLNFDSKINMFSSAPPLSSNWSNALSGGLDDANTIIINMVQNMATTNPSDASVEPFTYFYAGSSWLGQYIGKVIDYYDVSTANTGMFYEYFPFRSPSAATSGTDRYIDDYIEYVASSKVNDLIIDKIEANTTYSYPGIYVLSSSSGINNGIFIPDNFVIDGLNPYDLDSQEADTTWIGDTSQTDSVAYSLYEEMRQIKVSFATTIYNLEIVQTDSNGNIINDGLTLTDPVIDEERKMITYYLPSNAAVLGTQTASTLTVSKYVEVGDSYVDGARYVANTLTGDNVLDGYTWVGTYKKSGTSMVAIGPYATTGVYNLTTTDTTPYTTSSTSTVVYNLTSAADAVSATTTVFTYEPFVYTTFLWWKYWSAEGYRVTKTNASAGYGAYSSHTETSGGKSFTVYEYVGPYKSSLTYVYSASQSGVTVYPTSSVYFKANTEEDSYTISDTASLDYQGTSYAPVISIPRSYGVYDSMYTTGGTYIDSVEDHYGAVRVYSQEYSTGDSSTYQDYDIRIIRTANEDITDIDSLTLDGVSSLPGTFNVNSVTATTDLSYQTSGNNGILSLTYETYNVSNLFKFLPYVEVFDNNTGVKVFTSLYKLTGGVVVTDGDFNNDTGSWGYGASTIVFEAEDDFPSGDYYIQLTLLSDETFKVYFSKEESGNASVLNITYQGETIELDSNSYTSYIDYGIYYINGQSETNVVDFTNLSTLNSVYYDEVDTNLPSYLEGMEISNFAEIFYISYSVSIINGYQHQYAIVYHLIAEDGSTDTFTHYLLESPLDAAPSAIYKNGGTQDVSASTIIIGYQESPTVRIEYGFDDVFFATDQVLSVTSSFVPLITGETSTLDEDYFVQTINDIGYEVDLNQDISKGSYTYQLSYNQSVLVYGSTLTWQYTFNQVVLQKVENDNSHLDNVLFASESVFDEVLDAFVTIIDIEEVTPTEYLAYFDETNPTTRIISVLPTTGIDYDQYASYSSYWIIGQVQETDLTAYQPTFYIPDGSNIYRVIDENNLDYSYQSTILAADFTDFGNGTTLNYVHYRIYAEDYDDYPTHYTDYYIAVQDSTNNIKFDISVENDTADLIEQVYVKVNVYQFASDYEGELTYDDILITMGLFSYYDSASDTYDNNQFETSMYGFYVVLVELPEGYTFELEFDQSYIQGLIYLESSRIPTRYYVTVHIIEETPDTPDWGYQVIFEYIPTAEPLDINATYTSGDRFIYNDITWIVIDSSYIYDQSNPPGTGAWQGLQDASGIYSSVSAYEIGDIVIYNGVYYEAIATNASYTNPVSGLGEAWNEISENWLYYNLYTTDDIVLYNGVYYISTASWNKNYQPDTTTWAWQVYN